MKLASMHALELGHGRVVHHLQYTQLSLAVVDASHYHDAQLVDYHGLVRPLFPWRPPVRLSLKARASHSVDQLRGTMGFGFWNNPFMPGERFFRLPRAVWFFFGSPPGDIALARGVPGYGWKAATFNAARWPFLTLAPFSPLGFLLMRVPVLFELLWPVGQWSIGVSEAALNIDLTEWHNYEIHWRPRDTLFFVDGQLLHYAPFSPRGPLGFITWIDNQYAIVTPQGRLGWGLVAVPTEQQLLLQDVQIESM